MTLYCGTLKILKTLNQTFETDKNNFSDTLEFNQISTETKQTPNQEKTYTK